MKNFKQMIVAVTLLASILVSGFTQFNVKAHAEDSLDIAIVQFVSHPSLDQIVQGIKDELAANDYVEGENLTIEFHNAEADINLLGTIAEQVVSQEPDLIFAVTTPVSQAFQNQTSDIPIIMAGVTDPVSAGLVENVEKPGENITGTSDAFPLEKHFDLMLQIDPDIKKIGMIYTSSEDNAQAEIESAKEVAEGMGLEVVIEGIATTLDMQMVAENLSSQVDAIYVGSDNTIASAFETLLDATDRMDIAVYPSVDNMVEQGGLAAVAINQADLGIEAARIAIQVLNGTSIGDIPIHFVENLRLVYNSDTAERLNVEISVDLVSTLEDLGGE
ncbi:ABC transporter substrate binding protein [Fundicoccus sp. Sow4_D5]|uniref:ABC transporter substrate binding protein n=1 Tax=unclassified Fundicoccus TaxID=2761543 RepID=UPI003F92CD48